MRTWRKFLHGSQVILITDHSSLLALKGTKQLKSMRQQRYAMDISEYSMTIVHRAGALLHTADALSRLGYTQASGESVVNAIRSRNIEDCGQEQLERDVFAAMRNGAHLKARLAAASVGGESIWDIEERLANEEVEESLVPESEEEESRAVEMWSQVCATRPGLKQRSKHRQERSNHQLQFPYI